MAGGVAHHSVVDESADLGRQLRGLWLGALQQHATDGVANRVDVAGRQQRRVQNHGADPIGVTDADPRRDIAPVRRAVQHRLVDPGVAENRGHVVDYLIDRDGLGRQVGAGVGVPRHADSAVFDHDDVKPLDRGPTPPAAIQLHRRHPGPAGDDDQRMGRLAAGAHVVQVELFVTAG